MFALPVAQSVELAALLDRAVGIVEVLQVAAVLGVTVGAAGDEQPVAQGGFGQLGTVPERTAAVDIRGIIEGGGPGGGVVLGEGTFGQHGCRAAAQQVQLQYPVAAGEAVRAVKAKAQGILPRTHIIDGYAQADGVEAAAQSAVVGSGGFHLGGGVGQVDPAAVVEAQAGLGPAFGVYQRIAVGGPVEGKAQVVDIRSILYREMDGGDVAVGPQHLYG